MWPFGCERMAAGYDHDHETDVVRLALCAHHNSTIKSCGDTASTLRQLADVIESADMGFTYTEYRRQYNVAVHRRESQRLRRRQWWASPAGQALKVKRKAIRKGEAHK
jgi:hypothetical protein